jgi:hypothetical protein
MYTIIESGCEKQEEKKNKKKKNQKIPSFMHVYYGVYRREQ